MAEWDRRCWSHRSIITSNPSEWAHQSQAGGGLLVNLLIDILRVVQEFQLDGLVVALLPGVVWTVVVFVPAQKDLFSGGK